MAEVLEHTEFCEGTSGFPDIETQERSYLDNEVRNIKVIALMQQTEQGRRALDALANINLLAEPIA